MPVTLNNTVGSTILYNNIINSTIAIIRNTRVFKYLYPLLEILFYLTTVSNQVYLRTNTS